MTTQQQPQSFTYHDPNLRGTVVGVVQNNLLVFGLAMRNYQDQFSRKLGRTIALGRAEKRPIDAIEIGQDNPVELFYQTAPRLIEKKRDQILQRQLI